MKALSPRLLLVFFLLLCGTSGNAFSDYPGFTPVKNFSDFKKNFVVAAANVKTVHGNFKQEKNMVALTEKITSYGELWFKRENKVRMDYTSPFFYKMIINGDKMLVLDDQKETQINVRSNKLFQQVNRLVIDCMQGTILESNDFTTRVFEDESSYLMEFTPSNKNLKQFVTTIILLIDKKDSSPRSIKLIESTGDETLITISNKKVNSPLQDEIFAF